MTPEDARHSIHVLSTPDDLRDDGQELIAGLSRQPKVIPSRYFYDDEGSRLFEQLCEQPEYYPTRIETAILERYTDEIIDTIGCCEIVELGCGNAQKTSVLLTGLVRAGCAPRFIGIDINTDVLERGAEALHDVIPGLRFVGLAGTYERGLGALPARTGPRLFLFLGSTIGNFTDSEIADFMGMVHEACVADDHLLIGTDLDKDSTFLEAAYNDSAGIAERSNLNVLSHLNWRFDADFDLEQFRHLAFHNRRQLRMEAHLESLKNQMVRLRELDISVSLARGERVQTEIMRKFQHHQFVSVINGAAFRHVRSWFDKHRWYAVSLFKTDPKSAN